MKPIKAELIRNKYTEKATFGEFRIYGEDGSLLFSCFTLEDVARPIGVKVKHSTAIFEGVYRLLVNRSPKFKRLLPLVLGAFGFIGIRFHRGQNIYHTSGCVIVGDRIDEKTEKIFGGLEVEKQIVKILKGYEITFEVKNGFQVG